MAKGNRETKQPKKVVTKTIAAADSLKAGGPKIVPARSAGKKK